jgi:RNA polymerase subunit RPABC4/transcription elongation factor Spt4
MTSEADETRSEGVEQHERVRVCPECSEIVSFDERLCPACGHRDPLLDFPALGAATRTCESCGVALLHTLLFCPECGQEKAPLEGGPAVARDRSEFESGDARSYVRLAWVIALLGPLAMLAAALSLS